MANTYKLDVTRTVDGDTIYGNLILDDFNMIMKDQKLRFIGIDTPERGYQGYYEAKEFTANICDGNTLEIILHGKDSFGRWLVDVFYEELNEKKSLNEELLRLGLASIYVD
jgi:micrococcal nuclease